MSSAHENSDRCGWCSQACYVEAGGGRTEVQRLEALPTLVHDDEVGGDQSL